MNATSAPSDREISLGTGTILGLFFALAVVCAVFFGFGYSVGSSHHAHIPAGTAAAVPEPAANPIFSTFKPASGSPAAAPVRASASIPAAASDPAVSTVVVPSKPAKAVPFDPDANIVTSVDPAPKPVRVAAPAPVIVPGAPAASIVQVAAVSHQDDADLLVSHLQRRGYSVAVRSEPQDKLLHVQIGPFPTKKDADAMRQRLLADGFNAIVK